MEEIPPKVLLVTRNLPPLIGGMERLLLEAAKGLSEYAHLTVIGPKGCSAFLPGKIRVLETSAGLTGFLAASLWKAIVLCRREYFDLVIGGSGVTAPCLAVLKRLYRLRTAIFLHGLDLVAPNYIYQHVFVPAIRKSDLLIANSRNTARLAEERGVAPEQLTVINPGCHPPDKDAYQRAGSFREEHGIPPGPVMLFVGRMTRRKGLSVFVRRCLVEIIEKVPHAQLVIVGDQPHNALNREGEKQDVLEAVRGLPTPMQEHIHFVGSVSDRDLNTSYALADVHVFPLQEVPGDIEGFGMVVIEAASYGTPTVAFDAGGVSDAINTSGGALIRKENYNEFSKAVTRAIKIAEGKDERKTAVTMKSGWEEFHQKLRKTFHPPKIL